MTTLYLFIIPQAIVNAELWMLSYKKDKYCTNELSKKSVRICRLDHVTNENIRRVTKSEDTVVEVAKLRGLEWLFVIGWTRRPKIWRWVPSGKRRSWSEGARSNMKTMAEDVVKLVGNHIVYCVESVRRISYYTLRVHESYMNTRARAHTLKKKHGCTQIIREALCYVLKIVICNHLRHEFNHVINILKFSVKCGSKKKVNNALNLKNSTNLSNGKANTLIEEHRLYTLR